MSYACLYDQDSRIIGLWVSNRSDADSGVTLATWLIIVGAGHLSQDALVGNVRITPNNVDNRGGYFVFVGEAARMRAIPRQRRWWQFWK
jgi:hypothetical protein